MQDQQQRQMEAQKNTGVATRTVSAADDEIDLIELMYRLLASWKLIVCLALVFALAAGVVTAYLITPLYQATSVIYVLNRDDSAINLSDIQLGTALTQDYIKIFSTWEVHEEVISKLDLPYTYRQIQSMLTITNDSNTRMLNITVSSPSPEEAAAVANEYARVGSQHIADTMSTSRPNIVSTALEPSNPVSPSMTRNVMIGFLLGAMLAVGIVTMQMLLDDKYKTADDIRRYTGLVTLAIVPLAEEAYDKKRSR